VAALVARGLGTAEVAYELVLSPKTVEWHLRVYRKLGARSRAELAGLLAQRDGSPRRQV
jgi:DNA-binding CsgD family transcriptional regulator